jgi:energy-converting hydrogenase Eha subunit A
MLIYTVNVWGVILATVSTMIIGGLWYSPVMFGTERKRKFSLRTVSMIIPAFVLAYVLSFFIRNMFVHNLIQALQIGFFAWLGFCLTAMIPEYLFNSKTKLGESFGIDVGYQLACVLINTIIIFLFL